MEEAFGEADGQNSWSFLTSTDALAKSAISSSGEHRLQSNRLPISWVSILGSSL